MPDQRARLIIEVLAGVVPERPDPEFTRRYAISEDDWAKARASDTMGSEEALLAEVAGKAQGYAMLLMLQSNHLNWVRTDWIWL